MKTIEEAACELLKDLNSHLPGFAIAIYHGKDGRSLEVKLSKFKKLL